MGEEKRGGKKKGEDGQRLEREWKKGERSWNRAADWLRPAL